MIEPIMVKLRQVKISEVCEIVQLFQILQMDGILSQIQTSDWEMSQMKQFVPMYYCAAHIEICQVLKP